MSRSVTTLLDDTALTDEVTAVTAGEVRVLSNEDWAEVSPSAVGRSVADGVTTAYSPTVTSHRGLRCR